MENFRKECKGFIKSKVKEVEGELARSLSPTPGQTPKASLQKTKMAKLQLVGEHGPSIAPSNFTWLSRSPIPIARVLLKSYFPP